MREATDLQEKRHTDDVRLTNISERVRPRTDHVCDVPACRRTGARDVQSRAHRSHALDDALKAPSVLRNRVLFELFRSSKCWSRIGARSIARRFCRRHYNLCKRGHSIPVRRDFKISDSDCASGVRLLRGRECIGEQRQEPVLGAFRRAYEQCGGHVWRARFDKCLSLDAIISTSSWASLA